MAVFRSSPIAPRFGRTVLMSVALVVAFSSAGFVDPAESVISCTFARPSLENRR